jgi:hypothetical protein
MHPPPSSVLSKNTGPPCPRQCWPRNLPNKTSLGSRVSRVIVLGSPGGSPSSCGSSVSALVPQRSTSITHRSIFSTTVNSVLSLSKISTPSTLMTGLPTSSSAVSGVYTSFRHSSARLIFSISNNEFEMTTASDKNLFVQNGQLYIHPTLTSDEIGSDAIFNGGSYELGVCVPLFIDRHLISWHCLQDCTNSTSSACSINSDSSQKIVIPPVQSARISTRNSYSIRYGKVEVKAKLPRGCVSLSPHCIHAPSDVSTAIGCGQRFGCSQWIVYTELGLPAVKST